MTEKSIVIEIDKEKNNIEVYRIDDSDKRILLTQYPIQKAKAVGFETFAKQIGEDILMISSNIRGVFDY